MAQFHAFENQTAHNQELKTAENPQLNLLAAIGEGAFGGMASKLSTGDFWKGVKSQTSCFTQKDDSFLSSLMKGDIHLPHIDFSDLKGLLEGDASGLDFGKQRAKRAADIIANGGDFGSDTQKKEIQEMFEEAYKKGPEAVAKLVKDINAELEKRGSDVRVSVEQDFNPGPTWGEKKYGNVVVCKDGVVEDRVGVWENDPMKRNLL